MPRAEDNASYTIHPNWPDDIREKAYYLRFQIYQEGGSGAVPARNLCLKAFDMDPNDVRVIILGQDPYPQPGKAVGRAFAVPPGWPYIGSSIKNIIDEVHRDTRQIVDPTLQSWTDQGVLLLNTRLTGLAGKPMSHAGLGWEELIADVLYYLDSQGRKVYLAWGKEAQKFCKDIKGDVLKASHPCKHSAWRSFKGCGHFSSTNALLKQYKKAPIVWGTPDPSRE